MIRSIEQRADNLVAIHLQERMDYIACELLYKSDEGWLPASLVPDLDAQTVLSGNSYLWNQAQTLGTVRLYERGATLYWNPYVDVGVYAGKVELKLTTIAVDGESEHFGEAELRDTGVVYWADWASVVGDSDGAADGSGWTVRRDARGRAALTVSSREPLPPLKIPLSAVGTFDIYFGLPSGGLRLLANLSGRPRERVVTTGGSMDLNKSDFGGKRNKEVFWGRHRLDGECLEFSQLLETITEHYSFGQIGYIKLVPCEANEAATLPGYGLAGDGRVGRLATDDLILYYEPYSYSLHGFHDAATMNEIMMEEFIRLRPREITCQTVRVGMKALHHSEVLQPIDIPSRTDENTVIDDPVKLVRSCDIMAESAAYLQGKAIQFTANIGMNRPYLFLPELSERFTRENSGLIVNGNFDYTQPAVQQYAMAIIDELIERYEIDGLVFDYMRSYENQTVESLLETIRRTRQSLNRKQRHTGSRLELKVRIPADQLVYYRAMREAVAERWLDGIIPSNSVTSEPLPPVEHYVRLCRGTGVRVYGCIDGWKHIPDNEPRAGNLGIAHTPRDLIRYVDEYGRRGVDGIFLYQADQFSANPYLNKLFGGPAR